MPGTRLTWHNAGEKYFETGVKDVALFTKTAEGGGYATGVAWNGITAITESPSGAESTPLYADDFKYLNLISSEEFGATIEAYTYPDEFAVCDGSASLSTGVTIGQQPRKQFGLVYKTAVGNEEDGSSHAYKLHVIYNAFAAPSERAYSSINDSPEAITFSWEVTTTPVEVTGHKPTATVTIDSRTVPAAAMAAIDAKLYGSSEADATLVEPNALLALITAATTPQTPQG